MHKPVRWYVVVETSGKYGNVVTGARPFTTHKEAAKFFNLIHNQFGCKGYLCRAEHYTKN